MLSESQMWIGKKSHKDFLVTCIIRLICCRFSSHRCHIKPQNARCNVVQLTATPRIVTSNDMLMKNDDKRQEYLWGSVTLLSFVSTILSATTLHVLLGVATAPPTTRNLTGASSSSLSVGAQHGIDICFASHNDHIYTVKKVVKVCIDRPYWSNFGSRLLEHL